MPHMLILFLFLTFAARIFCSSKFSFPVKLIIKFMRQTQKNNMLSIFFMQAQSCSNNLQHKKLILEKLLTRFINILSIPVFIYRRYLFSNTYLLSYLSNLRSIQSKRVIYNQYFVLVQILFHFFSFYNQINQLKMGSCTPKHKQIVSTNQSQPSQDNHHLIDSYQPAKVYLLKGDNENAIFCFPSAIQDNSMSSASLSDIGNSYLKMEYYTNAIDCFRQSLKMTPHNKYAYNGLGVAYEILGEDEQSITNFKKSIQIDSNFSYPYNGLGNISYRKKNYGQSLRYYQKAVQLEKDNPLILVNLAYCQLVLGKKQQAIRTYKKIKELRKQGEQSNCLQEKLNQLRIRFLKQKEKAKSGKEEKEYIEVRGVEPYAQQIQQ